VAPTERLGGTADPNLPIPAWRKVANIDRVDSPQALSDRVDRFRATCPPLITNGRFAGNRLRDEPLGFIVAAVGDNPGCGMPPSYPLEADTLAVEIDTCATRIPLHEPVADPKRQPTEFIAPDQVGHTTVRQLGHDIGERIIPKCVDSARGGSSPGSVMQCGILGNASTAADTPTLRNRHVSQSDGSSIGCLYPSVSPDIAWL